MVVAQSDGLPFGGAGNPEPSSWKKRRNLAAYSRLKPVLVGRARAATLRMMPAGSALGDDASMYDDEYLMQLSGGFSDWISVFPVVGDAIRALGGLLRRRKGLSADELVAAAVDEVSSRGYIARKDVAELTRISPVQGNRLLPFMNGGPVGENWDVAPGGFFDQIARSQETIVGVELGFKADDYGTEVSDKLIAKKRANPRMNIALLVDGFVSVMMQKPSTDFEKNTVDMILDMRKAGIDVRVNDSSNPLSTDFFSANHVKLWIFDGKTAFFGGIGMESQFRRTLYDEMDLVQGPFVNTLNMIALLLMANQRGAIFAGGEDQEINRLGKDRLLSLFAPSQGEPGTVTMKLVMDVPGYVQDARNEYAKLLSRDELDEVYIMAPYFSDEKIARAIIRAANRLLARLKKEKAYAVSLQNPSLQAREIETLVAKQLAADKRIHVVLPTKQENVVIADISKYYAYHMRNNPIVDTRELSGQTAAGPFQMLHAKQMVAVLRRLNPDWTKYVKFGGSYNPAGKAQHMWELNAVAYNGDWERSDDGPGAPPENPIKDYLENVMKKAVSDYSVPLPWGEAGAKLSVGEKVSFDLAAAFWFLT